MTASRVELPPGPRDRGMMNNFQRVLSWEGSRCDMCTLVVVRSGCIGNYQLGRICKLSIIENRYFFFFHKADLILLYFCLEGSASPPEFLEQYAGYLARLSLHNQAQSSLSSIVSSPYYVVAIASVSFI